MSLPIEPKIIGIPKLSDLKEAIIEALSEGAKQALQEASEYEVVIQIRKKQ